MKILPSVFAALLLFAFGAKAQTTNGLSQAEIQGQQLAQEILEQCPTTNFTEQGTLRIRSSEGVTTNIHVAFSTIPQTNSWFVIYLAASTNEYWHNQMLTIHHFYDELTTRYEFSVTVLTNEEKEKKAGVIQMGVMPSKSFSLKGNQLMTPFADSDFWIADLGLEFFHWPGQKVIKHETRRTRACTVLESTNPDPSPGSYSRVDSWIDDESHGIIWAEAYDLNGKLLKEFDPKKIKKVNGQWELEEMDISNVQTGSRTRIKFNLDAGS